MNCLDSDKKRNQPEEVKTPKPAKIPNQIRMKSQMKNRWQRTKTEYILYEKEEPPEYFRMKNICC